MKYDPRIVRSIYAIDQLQCEVRGGNRYAILAARKMFVRLSKKRTSLMRLLQMLKMYAEHRHRRLQRGNSQDRDRSDGPEDVGGDELGEAGPDQGAE